MSLHNKLAGLLSALLLVSVTGCGGGYEQAEITSVVVPLNTRTCNITSGRTVADVRKHMEGAGVIVRKLSCAVYPFAYPAVCGMPTNELAIVEVNSSQLVLIRSLGYETPGGESPSPPVADVSTVSLAYVETECRPPL